MRAIAGGLPLAAQRVSAGSIRDARLAGAYAAAIATVKITVLAAPGTTGSAALTATKWTCDAAAIVAGYAPALHLRTFRAYRITAYTPTSDKPVAADNANSDVVKRCGDT